MAAEAPRTLKTVTGAGGQGPDIYDQAIDPSRSTLGVARLIAERAEEAQIDFLFTADLLRFGAQGAIGSQEPLMFVSALSGVTSRIGLIATVSTTFHDPFNLARFFGTLDHVSNGRAAWNLVTSSVGEENYGMPLPAPEDRYARAAESLDVIHALWDSWKAGALTAGERGRAVLDPAKVLPIDHEGRFFSVRGPLNIPPLPQGRPVQIQAGQSEAGIALGARYAEIVFTSLPTLDVAEQYTTNPESSRFLRVLCVAFGRVFSELPAVVPPVRAALSGRAQCGADCLRLQLESPPHLVAGVCRVAGDLVPPCFPAGVVGDPRGGDVFLAHVPEDKARLYGRAALVVADADSGPWAGPAAYVWPGKAVMVLQELQVPDCLVGERLLAHVHLLSICRADRCCQLGVVRAARAHEGILSMASASPHVLTGDAGFGAVADGGGVAD
ncbi:MAG: LLM class flavin-dependent oxidoreductase, partial [Trebonia sp.]